MKNYTLGAAVQLGYGAKYLLENYCVDSAPAGATERLARSKISTKRESVTAHSGIVIAYAPDYDSSNEVLTVTQRELDQVIYG